MAEHRILRSFLYAPGSDEHKMRKAIASGADAVVLDLEDSVVPGDKRGARESVGRLIEELSGGSPSEIHVRINRREEGFDLDDLARVVVPGLSAVRLPKCASPRDVTDVAQALTALEVERGMQDAAIRLYPTIESAGGVLAADQIAAAGPRVCALVFGSADFGASIGLFDPSFESTLLARSTLVLASAAAGVGRPIDGAYLNVADLEGLRAHSRRVSELGFSGKSAIHPKQLPVLHEVFTPTDAELERARRVVASEGTPGATGVVDGGFVDPPVVAQARAVLRLAQQIAERGM